jgi:SAM-dependent methyltransferase
MDKGYFIFNVIAPIYGWFYQSQKKHYQGILEKVKSEFNWQEFHDILDIGCGTGALSSVFNEKGLSVTAVDPVQRMLDIASSKPENCNIKYVKANVLKSLPFEDNSFDIVIASYVAHGLKAHERKVMYSEMKRIAKEYVILHDYNGQRALMTTLIEWLEGGDYFNFIRDVREEMERHPCDVRVVDVDKRAAWYICRAK